MRLRTRIATTAAVTLLLAVVVVPLRAQVPADSAPALAQGKDVNDWREYYDKGIELLGRQLPKSADPYFLWAARLNPQGATPVHMHWVALSLANPRLLEIEPGKGNARDEAERARIDSVLLEALRIDPFTPRHFARLVYEARPGYWGQDNFTQGYLAYTEARYDRALRLLERVTKGERLRPALMFRALSYYAMERFDSAAAQLQVLAELAAKDNATQLAPSYEGTALYLYGMGVARLRMGNLDGARDALERALGEDVSMAAAHVALAQVALRRADTAAVVREWGMALELRPASAAIHGDYANALRKIGRAADAVAEDERAIALEPLWAGPYFNEAMTLDALGRGEQAVARYAQFLQRTPAAYQQQIAIARDRIAKLNGGP